MSQWEARLASREKQLQQQEHQQPPQQRQQLQGQHPPGGGLGVRLTDFGAAVPERGGYDGKKLRGKAQSKYAVQAAELPEPGPRQEGTGGGAAPRMLPGLGGLGGMAMGFGGMSVPLHGRRSVMGV